MENVRIIVNFKRTIQTKPYESAIVQYGIEADLSEKEQYEDVAPETFSIVKEMVETEIDNIIAGENS